MTWTPLLLIAPAAGMAVFSALVAAALVTWMHVRHGVAFSALFGRTEDLNDG